jgi:hypothetical protein
MKNNLIYFQPDNDTLIDNQLLSSSVWISKNNCDRQFSKPSISILFENDDIKFPSFVDISVFETNDLNLINNIKKYSIMSFDSRLIDEFNGIDIILIFNNLTLIKDYLKKDNNLIKQINSFNPSTSFIIRFVKN